MKAMDLLELYQLTELYKRTYKPCRNVTVQKMLDTATERYAFQAKGEDIRSAHNPRGAWRPKIHGPEIVRKILYLREQGKTMRIIYHL